MIPVHCGNIVQSYSVTVLVVTRKRSKMSSTKLKQIKEVSLVSMYHIAATDMILQRRDSGKSKSRNRLTYINKISSYLEN